MVKCPKCKQQIEDLKNFQSGENIYIFDGKDYDFKSFIENGKVNDFECPECNKVLFTDEEEARKFLKEK